MKESPYILLADDDPDDLCIFLQAFHTVSPGTPIQTVSDGQAVLEFLDSRGPDALPTVIVLDYKMPGMSGPDVLQELAVRPGYAKIPKVIWSTSNRRQDIDHCTLLGAAGYFLKPASSSELAELIQKIKRMYMAQLRSLHQVP